MKRRGMIIVILIMVFFISIAYATLSERIDIIGVANISAEWQIEFTDINIISEKHADNLAMNAQDTLAIFEVDLLAPGAYIEYEIEITNNGTIDGELAEIITSFTEPTEPDEIQFFLSGATKGDKLNAGETTYVMVRVEWIGGMPTEQSKELQVLFLYIQDSTTLPVETLPIISLLGEQEVSVNVGEEYIDEGATAVDSNGDDITELIISETDLNINEAGVYTINYNVTDEYGKSAMEIIRIVKVTNVTLIGYWQLNGNGYDSSNNQNHGTNYGATATVDRNNDISQALHFNGQDNHIRSEHIDDYNVTDELTISAWVKRSGPQFHSWACIVNRNRDNGINLQHNETNTAFQFAVRTDTGRTHIDATPSGGIEDNIWYHLVGVYDGANIILYIDGVEAGRANRTGNVLVSTTPLLIGVWGHASHSDRYFYGDIDDVRFYNNALTPAEINNMYNEEQPNRHNITYQKNPTIGGELSKEIEIVNHGTATTGIDQISNDGYTFVNYSIASGTCAGSFDATIGKCSAVTEDLVIQANWITSSYLVNYQIDQGGEIIPLTRIVTHRFSSPPPNVIVEEGYDLLNFSIISGECGGTFNPTTGVCSSVTENMTIAANIIIHSFEDNFNRTELGDNWIIESGDITIENNTLKLRADHNSERSWLTLNKSFIQGNIEFNWYSDHQANNGSDMRFKFLTTGELVIDRAWSQNGYQVQWETWNHTDNYPLRLYRLNGSTSTLLGEFILPLNEGRDTWHHMLIDISDSEIKIYHNDDLVITSLDTTYRNQGSFIFGGREGINRTVFYDNFKSGE